MPISTDQLDALRVFEERAAEVNEKAVKGIVNRLIQNFKPILGRQANDKFFYRQAKLFDDFTRKSILARALNYIAGVYFTDQRRGEKIIQFVESFIDFLRSTNATVVKRNYWDWRRERAFMDIERDGLFASGDKHGAREVSAKIRRHELEILPAFKRAEPGKKRKRRVANGNQQGNQRRA